MKQTETSLAQYVWEWLEDELHEPRDGMVYSTAELNSPAFVQQLVKQAMEAYEGGAR